MARHVFVVSLLLFASPGLAWCQVPPAPAAARGYTTNTFDSKFDPSEVDLANSRTGGYKWYFWQFYGTKVPGSHVLAFNHPGITLSPESGAKRGFTLSTVAPSTGRDKLVGTAFGGGGYFEATLKFDPSALVYDSHYANAYPHGSPTFWSLPAERLMVPDAAHWKGQPAGYEHAMEVDFFEFNCAPQEHCYGGTLHEWYGIWNKTCPRFCQVASRNNKRRVPSNTDFNSFHKYGFLWVPATDTQSGYAEFYFDGQLMGDRVSWTKFRDQSPPTAPKSFSYPFADWNFGVIDEQHLVLMLSTGGDTPTAIKEVNVWQESATSNLHW